MGPRARLEALKKSFASGQEEIVFISSLPLCMTVVIMCTTTLMLNKTFQLNKMPQTVSLLILILGGYRFKSRPGHEYICEVPSIASFQIISNSLSSSHNSRCCQCHYINKYIN